jgi:hypothetical protein
METSSIHSKYEDVGLVMLASWEILWCLGGKSNQGQEHGVGELWALKPGWEFIANRGMSSMKCCFIQPRFTLILHNHSRGTIYSFL